MAVRFLTTSQNNWVHAGVVVAIALVVALFAFSDALFELVKRWAGQEEYSHGFLIPVVSAWLLWTRRQTFLPLEGQPKSAINSNINGHG